VLYQLSYDPECQTQLAEALRRYVVVTVCATVFFAMPDQSDRRDFVSGELGIENHSSQLRETDHDGKPPTGQQQNKNTDSIDFKLRKFPCRFGLAAGYASGFAG
jgi:hypothetical protein